MTLTWNKPARCETAACIEIAYQAPDRCENATCVEIAYQQPDRCEAGNCVEAGRCGCDGGTWYVRDSKHPNGPVLTFNQQEWDAFTGAIKAGQYDK